MSDVGLGASLELSITEALRRVDELGRAVDTASSAVISVDASRVAPAVSAAVDAADTAIVVTGDAADVTGSIDGAVEAANTSVVIEADAADITGSINGAVQAANTQVTVEGSVSPGLLASTDQLGDSLDAAATSGISLGKILAGVGAAGILAGLRALGDAASDLAESTSKAGVVFGQEFPAIERFATNAADAVGLSTQAALEAAGTFGNLFQALGTSREEAARLSPLVVQLAGDLASFNNIGTDEALEKLRSGLVGEIEPLRALGVSFTALDVSAKALELGLGGVGRELTEGEKVQARYALITEQTTLAQGDFARTSDGLANQQRILSAEFKNAAAAAGTDLLPAFLALVGEVRAVLPGLEQLGANVLPALGSALVALAPLLGTSVDLLVAVSPAIQLIATVVGLLPAPVVEVAGALLLMNRALAVTNALMATTKYQSAVAGLVAVRSAALVAAGGFTAAGGGALGLSAALGTLSFATLGPAAALAALVVPLVLYNRTLADARKEGAAFGADLRSSFDPATATLSELVQASGDLDDKIASLRGQVDDSFLGRNGVNRDFNEALNEGIDQAEAFKIEIDAAADSLKRAQAEAKFGPLVTSLTGTSDALARLSDTAPVARRAISDLRTDTNRTQEDFLDLAVALGTATLSEEQFADAATLLGTDVTSLRKFIADANAAVKSFVDTATGALPTLADAFRNVGDDSILSVREFRDALDDEASNLREFTLRLAGLTAAGFGDIAGVIAQQGPEIGGALVEELSAALASGNTLLLEQTRASLENFNGAWTDTTAYLRDTLGPEFVLTTGLIGSAATTTFGDNLDFGERLRIAGEVAALQMDTSGKAIAAIAATEGAAAATEYGKALGLDDEVIAASVAAGVAIGDAAPIGEARAAGASVGSSFGDGVAAGLLAKTGLVGRQAQELIFQAKLAADSAAEVGSPSKLFARVGAAMGDGIAMGMDQAGAGVVAAAERIVRDAAVSVAQVAPEVTRAAQAGAGAPAGGGGDSFTFDITVNPPAGMTAGEARVIGEAVADGAAERLAERNLSVLVRTIGSGS